jgi:hypothetical protein
VEWARQEELVSIFIVSGATAGRFAITICLGVVPVGWIWIL